MLLQDACLIFPCTFSNALHDDSIDPDFEKDDDHPPHNLRDGDNFLKIVYEAVRSSPLWNQTALVVTFDEHGGFYDHVPPPINVPIPDEPSAKTQIPYYNFDRLGVRVPTIIVSPHVEKGITISEGTDGRIFEHSSIPATLKKLFGLKDFLTKRDAWAATFDNVFTLEQPRNDCPLTIG